MRRRPTTWSTTLAVLLGSTSLSAGAVHLPTVAMELDGVSMDKLRGAIDMNPSPRSARATMPFNTPFTMPLPLLLLGLCLLWPLGAGAQVHRCTGANGVAEYRSLPCDGNSTTQRTLDLPHQQQQQQQQQRPPALPPSAGQGDAQRQAMNAELARLREATARMEQSGAARQAQTQGGRPAAPVPAALVAPARPPAPASDLGLGSPGRPGFGAPVQPVELPLLTPQSSPPPADVAALSEMVVITGYETNARVPEVVVDRPGQQVVLLLSTYEKVLWKVSATPGTRIQAILVSSLHKPVSAVSGPPGTRLWHIEEGYNSQPPTPEGFSAWSQAMRSRFGATRLHALRSDYRLAAVHRYDRPDPAIARLALPPPPPEKPSVHIRFELATLDQRRPVAWTNAGPEAPGDAARDYFMWGKETAGPRGTRFAIEGEGVVRANGDTRTPLAPMPPSFPPVSWPTDLAYDPVSGILALTTLGGEGFLYRYDVRADRWLDYRSVANMDITALAHDPVTRGFAAWTTDGELLVISAQGELTGRHRLGKAMGLSSSEPLGRPLLLAPRGDGIALVRVQGGTVQSIWTFNTATRAVQLTWRAPPADSRPAAKAVAQ